MAFYDSSTADRIAMTTRAMAAGKTLTELWQVLDHARNDPWSARAAEAARMLAGQPSVADLGCGTMTLERFLEPGTDYRPVDVVVRDGRTTVCDFNAAPLPYVEADAAACLGLVEYLYDPVAFLRRLATFYPTAVISYSVADGTSRVEARRANAWVNDMTRAQIERLFIKLGFDITRTVEIGRGQFLWHLT